MGRHLVRLLPVVLLLVLAVPGSGVRPTTLSLTKVEVAQGYDMPAGVVWILVLGSDRSSAAEVDQGDTDAIQLLGIDVDTGAAAAIGISRDTWVRTPDGGHDRINAVLAGTDGDEQAVADVVADLVGIAASYVLVSGGDGFLSMVDTLDGVVVDSDVAFTADDDPDLHIVVGPNELDAQEALDFATTREAFAGQGDIVRSHNHQALLLGLLTKLQERAQERGFMETMGLAAIDGIDPGNATPLDLYRLLNALTGVDPDQVSGCVVPGTDEVIEGKQVIVADAATARRYGDDVRDDAVYDEPC